MDRWSRWRVYLFWASVAGASVAVIAVGILEVARGDRHHAVYLAPALIFVAASALFYRDRAKSIGSLSENEARLRLLIEEASDAIFVSEIDSRRFVEVNRMATELTGYSREELTSMRVEDLVDFGPDEEADSVRLLRSGEAFRREEIVIGKDGSRIPIEVSAVAVTDRLTQAIVRPIGERKAVEEALRRSEEVFRAVSELTSDYAYSMAVHPDGSMTPEWLTGAFERVTGYPIDEVGRGWQTLVHPDDVPAMTELLAGALESGGTADSEFRIITKTGEIRHLRAVSRFERDNEDGRVVRIIGAVSDITEQTLLQESLAESEQRFKQLYERLPIGMYRRRWQGDGLDANDTCVEMFGYPDEKTYIEQDPSNYYADPQDRERWAAALEELGVVRNFEVLYRRWDGTQFWGRNTARLIRDAKGNAWIEGAVVDITEEKELNEELKSTLRELRRADMEKRRLLTHLVRAKEEERNRVASDIHDDSVQLMTAVAIDLERLARKTADTELSESLGRVENRVRDSVQRLRKMVFELRPPALDDEGLAPALRLYLEEFSIDTGIEYELRNELEGEPINPTRVVLFRIAQEALTNIRKHSNATKVSVTLQRRDSGVSMVLSDDGAGFDVTSDELTNPGHIGLAEMRERAEMGGGTFHIESAPKKGTEVAVWVPEFAG
jgi:PAS domain S-box-containing protein